MKIWIGLISVMIAVHGCSGDKQIGKIVVEGNPAGEVACPVSIEMPSMSDLNATDACVLKSERTGRMLQAQFEGNHLLFVLPPGETGTFQLIQTSADSDPGLLVRENDSSLVILDQDRPVLNYMHRLTGPSGNDDFLYLRNGFIHPLWSPAGNVLTAIHPPDHLHHLGLWNPWTRVKYEDRYLDFWNLGKGEATVRHKRFIEMHDGPVRAGFGAEKIYLERTKEGKLEPVLNEVVHVRAWQVADFPGFFIDYIIEQECAGESPVLLEEYRYGGFGLRATAAWRNENRNYVTSEGDSIDTADGARARWCRIWGRAPKGVSTILFMSHTTNHEHPEPIRIWNKSFDDTFFNFCPIKKNDWLIEPGNVYTRKYRMYVTDGTLTDDLSEALWTAFTSSPKISLMSNNATANEN